jgi:hypothetical protein
MTLFARLLSENMLTPEQLPSPSAVGRETGVDLSHGPPTGSPGACGRGARRFVAGTG